MGFGPGPSNSIYVHCDVTDEEDVKNAIDTAITAYGKLDIMLNNAGIVGPNKPQIIDNEKSDFERVLSVDVTGVFLGMKHAARVMVPAKTGSIISMASIASNVAGVTSHAYCCAKHAVVVATPLATNYNGIQAEAFENVIHLTGNLKGVILKADDVANAALFLASEESKYISGQNICIDGGASIVNSALSIFKHPENI
ncbi:hypothetical protein E3N88_32877 [Mikania micrantha]|uniref:Uncharacterized protein n=1 Tax=Mikania micrantha TaxID=192012 RepID=A0A5N6MA71_9ASTR|nr:hypothetical protein E3N88_32877 [Mikania micrantha]